MEQTKAANLGLRYLAWCPIGTLANALNASSAVSRDNQGIKHGCVGENNVHVSGRGDRAIVFAHGFGCDQNMWRFVAPEFEYDFKIVLFDHVGAGGSDLSAYEKAKYSTLQGYADDLVEIGRAVGLKDAVFVGHSVSAMIGILASLKAPDLFGRMVLVGPSVRQVHRRRRLRGRLQRKADCGTSRVP